MTITILHHSPGQNAVIFLETLDNLGVRADGYLPNITKVVLPDLSIADGYPQSMTKIDTGLYCFQFTLPMMATSVGSYLFDVSYNPPGTDGYLSALYQIIVSAPFGRFSVTTQ